MRTKRSIRLSLTSGYGYAARALMTQKQGEVNMRSQIFYLSAIVAVLAFRPAHGADISSEVTNYDAERGEQDVRVTLTPINPKGPAITQFTDKLGKVSFKGIPPGEYQLEVTKVRFRPNPCLENLVVENKDVECKYSLRSNPYLAAKGDPPPTDEEMKSASVKTATRFVVLVKLDGGKREHYVHRWEELRSFNIDAKHKQLIVASIQEQDRQFFKEIPSAEEYIAPGFSEKVDAVHKLILPSLLGKEPIPAIGILKELKLDEDVLADIILTSLHDPRVKPAAKSAFIQGASKSWKGTKSLGIIGLHEQGMWQHESLKLEFDPSKYQMKDG